MFLLQVAACTLFPSLLVTAELQPLQPTVNFGTQNRDTAIRELFCKDGFFCVNDKHCCLDGWGCCASLLFFPTLRVKFQLDISQMVAAVSLGEYLLELKVSTF